MSSTIGAFEAKTRFSELLEQVSRGAEITITRHEKPVAKLVPFEKCDKPDWDELFDRMRSFRANHPLNPKGQSKVSYRDLIDAGRKR
jgi:prevent-host-death family protein